MLFTQLRRRDFITLLGGAAAAWPLAAQAQHPAQLVRRIGMLSGFAEDRLVESELLPTLSQLGWDNGRNVQIDLRWGAGNIDRIKMMAKELVASQPEIIITVGTPATVAVQRETRTIPIIFLIVAGVEPTKSEHRSTVAEVTVTKRTQCPSPIGHPIGCEAARSQVIDSAGREGYV